MQNDEDGFEVAVVGLKQREAVRRISKLFGLHIQRSSRWARATAVRAVTGKQGPRDSETEGLSDCGSREWIGPR